MKKYAIILGLLVAATSAMAQGNEATLNQYGQFNNAAIKQYQNNTLKATITQINNTWMWGNGAVIEQNQPNQVGTIYQDGQINFASLLQGDNGATGAIGTITQLGFHNLSLVQQEKKGTANVLQIGFGNIVAGGEIDFTRFSCHVPCYKDWCFNWCDLTVHTWGSPSYGPAVLGKSDFELIHLGYYNRFFAGNELQGTQVINQTNWYVFNKHAGNFIYLEQTDGTATLTQNGFKNAIWLKLNGNKNTTATITQVGGPNNLVALEQTTGTSNIYQNGSNNQVAYFNGICDNCATDYAKFEGNDLSVNQVGNYNRLNIVSTTPNSVITVNQIGNYNGGTVIQMKKAPVGVACATCPQ